MGVLSWDEEVIMPPKGNDVRADQMGTLSVLSHQKLTDPQVADWLSAAEESSDNLSDWDQRNLELMRRKYDLATALPDDLVRSLSEATTKCNFAWRQARTDDDWSAIEDQLKNVFDLTREEGQAYTDVLDTDDPYSALHEQYDPGSSDDRIARIFGRLEDFLPDFIQQVVEFQKTQPPIPPLTGEFADDQQMELGRRVAEATGFDFDGGRLDISTHPFSTGYPGDKRITTRIEDDPVKMVMTVLHEAGHAMYDNYLPSDWMGQPVGGDSRLSIHESQSLILEKLAGRTREFSEWLSDEMIDLFGSNHRDVFNPTPLHRRLIRVEPGYIRVEADEVTYPMHVILRWRIERDVIRNDMTVGEIPGRWNDLMDEYLGITPPNNTKGCLQDTHWFAGLIGYFPTYTLGALGAAQLFESATQEKSDIRPALVDGNFAPLVTWLTEHIHQFGRLKTPEELMADATGSKLGTDAFQQHLKQRYLPELEGKSALAG
jgi:carboxypeptidase Taq